MHPPGSLCHYSYLIYEAITLNSVEVLPIIEFTWELLAMQITKFNYALGKGEFGWVDHAATAELNYNVTSNNIYYSDREFVANFLERLPVYHKEKYETTGIGEGLSVKMKL